MNKPLFYIIILHYGNIKDTMKCLQSVGNLKTKGFGIRIILINNNPESKIHSPERKAIFHNCKIINNKLNLGFAAGVNIGIRKALEDAKTDYILLLNNDTIVPTNLLINLIKDSLDIVSPVIISTNGKGHIRYDYGGKINWWIGRTKHIEKNSKLIHSASSGRATYNSKVNENIDYVSGCCMLVKREVFDNIGLFDERFFMYFEDVDFCTRVKRSGFQIGVNPDTDIKHQLGSFNGRSSGTRVLQNIKSNYLFINKYLGLRRFLGYLYLAALIVKILVNHSI